MNLFKILPVCSLILLVACGDENTDSIFNVESAFSSSAITPASSFTVVPASSGNLPSSSTISITSSSVKVSSSSSLAISATSSSWSAAIGFSSSSSQNVILSSSDNSTSSSTGSGSSSSQNVILSSSEGSGSSSSQNVILSSSDNSTSSSTGSGSSSSSLIASSSAILVVSSSSEAATDPTKIFDIRVPDQKFLPCRDSIVSINLREDWIDTVGQSDIICSFKYDGDSGFVYVQNNPVSCRLTVGLISYEVHKAEFFVNGSMKEISNVRYHGGGNHGIFGLQFTYKGKVFKYDYSTMGMGGRPCQNMDCMMVLESDGKTVVQNGCDEDRSLPIVCRHAKVDGTFDSFEDSFHVCKSGAYLD